MRFRRVHSHSLISLLTHFLAKISILYLLQTLENLWFPGFFWGGGGMGGEGGRGYEIGALAKKKFKKFILLVTQIAVSCDFIRKTLKEFEVENVS